MINIVITHGYSDSNKGDLAITLATVLGLKKAFPVSRITLLSTFRAEDPDFWYHNRKMKEMGIEIISGVLPTPYIGNQASFLHNIQAVYRLIKDVAQLKISLFSNFLGQILGGSQYKAVHVLKEADLIVVKGGQFIYNDKEDLRGNLFLWRTLQPIKVARQLNKKVILLGQSIGGFASSKSEKVAIKYLSMCDRVVVRESLSYDLLESYGIRHLELQPDLAFYIEQGNKDFDFSMANGNEILGITIVNWTFPEKSNPKMAKESYIENLMDSIEDASKKWGLFPVLIPQVTVRHHGKSDLDLMEKIHKELKTRGIDSLVLSEDFSVEEMVNIYSKCKLLIGTRLHSCILSAVAGTPVIAIRYQGFKTQGVMQQLGLGEFVHDINNLKSNGISRDINIIMETFDIQKDNISKRVTELKEDLENVFHGLRDWV
ncbi:polysaccharide pyruvyl transferase family protein [Maribacter thermophilus]|uniref:polysaccharide pyruvyl transferase family protein n=1 Tax=Maribacter thermophilus TaxID=1197874 RepID=UPI000640C6E2|nr:polysaccharide pyruvyl transferase family protein [Maribacter thermophilus]